MYPKVYEIHVTDPTLPLPLRGRVGSVIFFSMHYKLDTIVLKCLFLLKLLY